MKIFKWRTLKSIKDFSRFNLDEPRIFKVRTRLGFQGILFSSQGFNIKTYQGFFKFQPWKPWTFQGKDKVRISRNLATLVWIFKCLKIEVCRSKGCKVISYQSWRSQEKVCCPIPAQLDPIGLHSSMPWVESFSKFDGW